jgi:putative ABC transport system permease protein
MIHSYFKIALRTLKKHKQFSIINIFGLSMALIVAICIMLYVEDEMSYDRFHPNAEQLYRVTMETRFSEKDFHTAWTPPFIAARMKEELPAVENYATLYKHFKGFSIKKENEEISIEDVYYSSPNFFEVFGFRLKYGNPKTALAHPDNIVLSEELIDKLFPGETVMGTTIETINGPKKVTGIMAENDHNSHFHPSVLTSIIGHWDIEELSTAVNFDATFYNYIVLSPGSKIPSGKMSELTERYARSWINADQQRKEQFGDQPIKFQLQNVRDIHLESNLEFEMETNGDKATVRLFMLVAILIVIVASVNYTNLASTRYLERMKELGIRKVLGSQRWQLIMQFFTESLIITFASVLIALLFLQLMLPVFNSIAGKSFDFHQLSEFKIMAGIGILTFGCALLSTIYPAFFISNIKAISIFQVNSAGIGKGNRFRRMILIL